MKKTKKEEEPTQCGICMLTPAQAAYCKVKTPCPKGHPKKEET